jgi:hypothetical protein
MATKKKSAKDGKGRVLTPAEKRRVLKVLDAALKTHKNLQLQVEQAKKHLLGFDFTDS